MKTFQTSSSSNIVNLTVLNHKSSLEHAHREIELIYVIKGDLQVKISGEDYHLSSSEIILINSNEFHSFQSNQDNLFVMIHFNYDELTSLLSQRNLSFSRNSSKQNSAHHEISIAIEELLTIYMKQDPGSPMEFLEKAYKLSSLLISKLMKKNHHQTLDYNVTLKGHDERLADIMDYIQSNFREPLSLDDVAGLYFLSSPYLSKFFKKQTGKTFSQYVNEVRLAHAVNELAYTDKLITRVALDNGFPNLAAFNRVFHEQYHIKPVDYRKQMQVDKKEGISIEENDKESFEAWIELKNYLTETTRKTPVKTELFSSTLSEQKKIKVEIENSSPISKNWNKLINVGYAKDLLISDMQEQIKQLQNEIGFTYARFWGLFGDDMLVEDRSGGKISYNFTNTNKLLDFLIQNKLKPFIEIGPKPKMLSKSIEERVVIQTISKKTSREWRNLTRSFLLQCVERYGIEEVETWYFEIWRHPDLLILDLDNDTDLAENVRKTKDTNQDQFEEYFRIFNGFKRTVNEIVPSVKVGGCGLSMDIEGDKLDLLLHEWKQQEFQPDFLSVYLFPIEVYSNKKQIPIKNLHSGDPDFVKNKLTQVRKTLKKIGLDDLELNVTEWNISISNRNFLNDSSYKAPYIIKNLIDNLNENNVNMIGYWLSSDIFSDFRDSKSFLYGGAGLVTKNGIQKPSYHAFTLLKQLGESVVAKGDHYIVTKKTGERYQILCFNYKHFKYSYYLNPEGSTGINEQYDIFENTEFIDCSLEVHGIRNGKYRIKEIKLNRANGSVLDEWLKFGAVDDIKPDEVKYLRQICVPHMKVEHAVVENQSIVLEAQLEPHEVRLFDINLLYD
jgi:xylan 1,4-beta-xylosidase